MRKSRKLPYGDYGRTTSIEQWSYPATEPTSYFEA